MRTLVGRAAPGFTATAVMPDNSIREDLSLEEYAGRYVVMFFYPEDFTVVCPSEILAFDHKLDDFSERECEVLGISVDPEARHAHWKNTPVDEGGIGSVRFPLLSDESRKITRAYGVLSDDGRALRATFLLDREAVVRHVVINDMSLGRSVHDTLRTLDAVRHIDRTGELCPANWERGRPAMKATPAGVKKFLRDFDLGA